MIRVSTAICMLMAGGSGLFLYQQKHHTQVLERQIVATVNATIAAKRRSHVLSAEWDLANDPERLAKLAEQFLSLRTMAPSQFAAIGDLAGRLPPLRAPGWKQEQTTEEPVENELDPVAEGPLPIPPPYAPPPHSPSPRPAMAGSATTLAATPASASASPSAPSTGAPTGTRQAGVSATVASVPAAPATPMRPTSQAAVPSPARAASVPVRSVVESPGNAQSSAQTGLQTSAASGGSSLGMARGISIAPPPVPISAPYGD